jgi:diguanylate cyclase (GGDEF)-like protein
VNSARNANPAVDGLGAQRATTRRRLSASQFVVLLALLGMAAALACVVAGYSLARQSDERHADAQRAALRAAIGEFRVLFGNGSEVDPRFVRMIEQSAGLKDVRFESEPSPAREMQPVLNAQGRIVGFLTWQTVAPMTMAIERMAPLVAVSAFALVGFAGFSLWQLRRSRIALAASEQQARDAAEVDAATGLPNQAKMLRLLDVAMAERRGQDVVSYGLMALDSIDGIVETYGQHALDEIAGLTGARLREKLPPDDVVCARVGAGTFALLWRGSQDPMALMRTAIEAGAYPHWIDGVVRVTAHAGFARAPADATSRDELIRRADLALRAAERKGPGAVVAFERAIDAEASDQQFIRRELPRALKAQALELHYQPIVAADDAHVVGLEALLRWTYKDRGAISPAQFIPVAEQIGLMDSLGEFVLRRALRDARNWPGLYISVNLSPVQMRDRGLVDVVREALRESATPPSKLMLEITEGVLIENPEEMLKRIGELRALGVRIALDDFGSGYSSLGYLQRFAFDKLKVDRSFVAALGRSPNAGVIIQAIVSLGRALGVTVVVEGVETEEQRVLLRLAGCDEMQGYLFARPAAAEAIDRLIKQTKAAKSVA